MNREQKALVVKELHGQMSTCSAAYLVGYSGLSVAQMQKLRKDLRTEGGSMVVAKGRLMKLAVNGIEGAGDLHPFLSNQIAVVFAEKEPLAVAKVLKTFSQKNDALNIKAGYFEYKVIDGAMVNRIASLPSREVLLGQVASMLNVAIVKLLWTLKKVAEEKQKEAQ